MVTEPKRLTLKELVTNPYLIVEFDVSGTFDRQGFLLSASASDL